MYFLNVLFFVLANVVLYGVYAQQKYTTRFDNVDVDAIIKSDRLLGNYVKCLLDKGRCTADGLELKKVIRDALETDCEKCSQTQKDGAIKVARHLIHKKPVWWNDLEAKYDPTGMYKKHFAKELQI